MQYMIKYAVFYSDVIFRACLCYKAVRHDGVVFRKSCLLVGRVVSNVAFSKKGNFV